MSTHVYASQHPSKNGLVLPQCNLDLVLRLGAQWGWLLKGLVRPCRKRQQPSACAHILHSREAAVACFREHSRRGLRSRASTNFRNRTSTLIVLAARLWQLDRSDRSGSAAQRCSRLHRPVNGPAWRAERLQPTTSHGREQQLLSTRRMWMWIPLSIRHPARTVIRATPPRHLDRPWRHLPRRRPGHGRQTTSCCEFLATVL
jgi:hypothetical protein